MSLKAKQEKWEGLRATKILDLNMFAQRKRGMKAFLFLLIFKLN